MRLRFPVLALLLLLAAAPIALAQEPDGDACEAELASWISNVTEDATAAEGGFQCSVSCVNGLWLSMRSGEPRVRDPPTQCAMLSGWGEDEGSDWLGHAQTPALDAIAGTRLAVDAEYAGFVDGLVLHAGAEPAAPSPA